MRGVGLIKRFFLERKVSRIHSRHRSTHVEEYETIDSVITNYRNNGGLSHHFQAYKLYQLREMLDLYQPKSILELGSGTTTAVIANYVRENKTRSAVILDENKKWLENSRIIAKVSSSDSAFTFVFSPKHENPDVPSTRYASVPLRSYDFVLIDGPSLTISGQKNKSSINTNIFDIIRNNPPKVILVDVRKATVESLQNEVHGLYDVLVSDVLLGHIRDDYRYFTCLTLNIQR